MPSVSEILRANRPLEPSVPSTREEVTPPTLTISIGPNTPYKLVFGSFFPDVSNPPALQTSSSISDVFERWMRMAKRTLESSIAEERTIDDSVSHPGLMKIDKSDPTTNVSERETERPEQRRGEPLQEVSRAGSRLSQASPGSLTRRIDDYLRERSRMGSRQSEALRQSPERRASDSLYEESPPRSQQSPQSPARRVSPSPPVPSRANSTRAARSQCTSWHSAEDYISPEDLTIRSSIRAPRSRELM